MGRAVLPDTTPARKEDAVRVRADGMQELESIEFIRVHPNNIRVIEDSVPYARVVLVYLVWGFRISSRESRIY